MTAALKKSLAHWPELSRDVFVPHPEAECQRFVRLPGQITDEGAHDDSYPLASLMGVIALLIEKYEDECVSELEEGCIVREEPPKA